MLTVALVGVIGAGAVGTIAVIHARSAEQGAAATAALPPARLDVIATPVRRETGYAVERRFVGLVAPRRSVELGFQIAGQVLSVDAELGATVESGATLAALDTRRNRLRLDELRAALAEAQANLELANADAERKRALLPGGAVTQAAVDQAVTARRTAQARIDQMRAQIASLEIDIADSALKAPFPAIVVERRIEKGAVVSAGATAFRLLESGVPEATFGLPVTKAAALQIGDAVPVLHRGRRLEGTVRATVPEVSGPTRTVSVIVTLPVQAGVAAGEAVELLRSEEMQEAGFWIPTAALVSDVRGLWAVQVAVPDGTRTVVRRAPVEVLHTADGRSFIRGTIEDGAKVIVEGTHRVSPGQQVAVHVAEAEVRR